MSSLDGLSNSDVTNLSERGLVVLQINVVELFTWHQPFQEEEEEAIHDENNRKNRPGKASELERPSH
jgi:hypothetical protein